MTDDGPHFGRADVCRHGGLRRKCETCDLESDLVEANRDKAEMLALLRECHLDDCVRCRLGRTCDTETLLKRLEE